MLMLDMKNYNKKVYIFIKKYVAEFFGERP